MTRELTGRHVLLICVTAFGIIIAVNLTLAFQAVATFPGLEVKNSYVASQSFDTDRAAQQRLGWTVETRLDDHGMLRLTFTDARGLPARVASVEGLFGRATVAGDDQTPVFERVGPASFVAPVEAARGAWMLRLTAVAEDGTAFRQRISVPVR